MDYNMKKIDSKDFTNSWSRILRIFEEIGEF